MPSRMKLFFYLIILTGAIAIFAIFFCPSPLPRIANTQVHYPVQDSGIFEEVFRYPDVFLRNYALMEKGFKIFIYPKDVLDQFYSEYLPQGTTFEVFFSLRLNLSERFHTNDDTEAHMFFIPLTWFEIGRMMQMKEMISFLSFFVRSRMGNDSNAQHNYAENYVRRIINEYPHWNRSKGFDHFLITCCDDGAIFSERVPLNNSIKASCQARNDARHHIRHKHHHITIPQLRQAFFPPPHASFVFCEFCFSCIFEMAYLIDRVACHVLEETSNSASHVTRIWGERGFLLIGSISGFPQIFSFWMILYEGYELPFGDILDWTKFSVIINKDDADRVEQILEDVSDSKFSELHNNIRKVQRHFHGDLRGHKPYDVIDMIMYELWLRHFARSF
ncbi:probable glycosyltransferase At3g42180 [Tripterygium wilfordii]|uniref:probable glycosyltransferase At3g42180 n=1 Tax=Tripterygium wilfordii TaxID=458696 RepID=UPI0018F7F910|nr:probable glycosyltransferase At3g42180 [Tripterygium wilfordii]